MFSYISLEERVPQDYPRRIRETVDEILRWMAKDFDGLYAFEQASRSRSIAETVPG